MWRRFIERGGWWVMAQSGLMVLVLALGPLCPGAGGSGVNRAIAWVWFGLGAVFGVGGALVLRGNRTIFPRPNARSRLVQHGVYRWVRHPLYTSLMLLAAGWSCFWWSWPTAVAGLVLAVFLNSKAAHEESWLKATFPNYGTYCQRVKRFFPKVF